VVVEVIRGAHDLGRPTALMLLAHMAASQPHLHALPPRALLVSFSLSCFASLFPFNLSFVRVCCSAA
jgi:hypothetical protein